MYFWRVSRWILNGVSSFLITLDLCLCIFRLPPLGSPLFLFLSSFLVSRVSVNLLHRPVRGERWLKAGSQGGFPSVEREVYRNRTGRVRYGSGGISSLVYTLLPRVRPRILISLPELKDKDGGQEKYPSDGLKWCAPLVWRWTDPGFETVENGRPDTIP